MKLRDAPVGTVLLDRDGDAWTRTKTGATIRPTRTSPGGRAVRWLTRDFDEAEVEFGPFRRADEVRP